jgi:hypothetical protein
MSELINLALMLTTMLVGALFMAFEALTGIQLFAVEPDDA